ncbi:hypothetical protein E1H12_08070 [Geitlerinema sp. P-1104]|uniref:hypothetical protein n=1 Tax=Geitlerinema sp. P-1104 TaxID=2546230 RepID=UPI001476C374|nr:hypothetical protein [Geitlerinema sp. P-1104]NMG58483.1 hypothetical protein [Geitlerinema sp. P-1104]
MPQSPKPRQFGFQQLSLLKPGTQGWNSPVPNLQVSSRSQSHDLKTKEIKEKFGKKAADCPMGWMNLRNDGLLLYHVGRDRWAVYRKSDF